MDNEPRWDAETLAGAEAIKNDPKRLSKAKKAAVSLAKEQTARADAMKSVAGKTKPKAKKKKQKAGRSGLNFLTGM